MNQQSLADFIWSVADVLRGDFKQSEFGRIILPFTVLRRLECVLEPTRDKVRGQHEALKNTGVELDLILPGIADATFYNTSQFALGSVGSTSTRANLEDYIAKFSANARQVFEHFAFDGWLSKLETANLLYLVTQKFASIDLHPNFISNHEMGLVFEHLIRKFAESANDSAGEFFTPRDVVRLATTLVFAPDHQALNGEGVVRTVYDCAAGTGGFLSSAIEQVAEWNPNARLVPCAQELNPETYAISVADKLIQGFETKNIKLGNTLSNDLLPHEQFDYCMASPPFGMSWVGAQAQIQSEHQSLGFAGRFGAGLPRVSDSSLLFLMHLLSKCKPVELGGTRIGIVLSGSSLFSGGAGSGESEIRRWILENDWLEAIIALPNDLFYNTGIGTYIWVLSNHKDALRKGKVQLIDATAMHAPMRKSLGSKRKYLSDEQISDITRLYEAGEESPDSKVFATADFGYRRITVERPLRLRFSVTPEKLASYESSKGAEHADLFARVEGSFDNLPAFLKAVGVKKLGKGAQKAILDCFGERDPDAQPMLDDKGQPQADSNMRKSENVPLSLQVEDYFESEVLPHAPDAWIDLGKLDGKDGQIGIVGYEINFHRIRLGSQMERLETQYKNYFVSNLGRLALEFNDTSPNEYFNDRENSIYIQKAGKVRVCSSLSDITGNHKNHIQVVLGPQAINEYIVSFFMSALGKLALEASMPGMTIPQLRKDELDKVAVALPDLEEQKNIVNTISKLAVLKKAIDAFDNELALNPTSSKAVLAQLDSMLNTIGGLTDADRVRNVVREGETERTEFKSSLSLDLRTQEKAKYIEDASFKTVAAFLNTNGGALLIGVSDSGEILGVNAEVIKFHKNNPDKFLLHWKNNLQNRIGEQYYPFISVRLADLDKKLVLLVECQSALIPCYLDGRDFYVRTNPATDKLEGPKLVEYVNNHFKPLSAP